MHQRMTRQKKIIMNIVQSHNDHPTADQIYLEVRAIDDHISRGTVYRNLDQLSDLGKLLHIKVPGPNRYDSRLDFHYHIVCRQCGAVSDVPLEYQYQLDQVIKEKTGFQVDRHRMFFEGICSDCQTANRTAALAE